MARIDVDLMIDSGRAVLVVDGGLDLSNAHRLGALLRKLVQEGCTDVIVDLGRVSRIDGSGVGIMRGAAAALRRTCGGTLRYHNANDQVAAVLAANELEEFKQAPAAEAVEAPPAKGATPVARAESAARRSAGQRPRSPRPPRPPRSAWSATT